MRDVAVESHPNVEEHDVRMGHLGQNPKDRHDCGIPLLEKREKWGTRPLPRNLTLCMIKDVI
jgi:hypothetical protein